MGVPMGRALEIRDDLGVHELRGWARKAGNGRASARAYAIANALDGLRRAARLAGMERQGLRDAVVRDNAEGLAGPLRPAEGAPGAASGRGRGGGAGGADPEGAGARRLRG